MVEPTRLNSRTHTHTSSTHHEHTTTTTSTRPGFRLHGPLMTNILKQHDRKRPVFSFQDEDDEDGNFTFEPLTKDAVDRAAFIAPNFDTDRFLASRRHLGLERLKVEFNNHLKFLKTELIELINRDYQDFIDLSTNLKGVDKAISNIRGPLKRMEHEALVCKEGGSHGMDKKWIDIEI